MKKSVSFKTLLLSLVVMTLWGSLYPIVKVGYAAFGISGKSVPDILMFAGMRFVVSAILLGENIFRLQYLLAFLLISTGIILGNKSEATK